VGRSTLDIDFRATTGQKMQKTVGARSPGRPVRPLGIVILPGGEKRQVNAVEIIDAMAAGF